MASHSPSSIHTAGESIFERNENLDSKCAVNAHNTAPETVNETKTKANEDINQLREQRQYNSSSSIKVDPEANEEEKWDSSVDEDHVNFEAIIRLNEQHLRFAQMPSTLSEPTTPSPSSQQPSLIDSSSSCYPHSLPSPQHHEAVVVKNNSNHNNNNYHHSNHLHRHSYEGNIINFVKVERTTTPSPTITTSTIAVAHNDNNTQNNAYGQALLSHHSPVALPSSASIIAKVVTTQAATSSDRLFVTGITKNPETKTGKFILQQLNGVKGESLSFIEAIELIRKCILKKQHEDPQHFLLFTKKERSEIHSLLRPSLQLQSVNEYIKMASAPERTYNLMVRLSQKYHYGSPSTFRILRTRPETEQYAILLDMLHNDVRVNIACARYDEKHKKITV